MASPASLGDAPPQDDDEKADDEITLVPHEGYVHLDQREDGRWQLTHSATCERLILVAPMEGCKYELVFDDGFGIVLTIAGDGAEVEERAMFVEDLLQYSFYTGAKGERCIVRFEKGRDEPTIVNLADFGRQFTESEMHVTFGPSRKVSGFDIAVFRWARGAAKIFISLVSLYAALAMTQFGGQASRWIYNCRGRWAKVFDKFGVSQALQLSSQVGKLGKACADGSECGDLPFTGISPAGAILLLDRMSLRIERHGGLKGDAARLSARWMLEALLAGALHDCDSLAIDLVREWTTAYPRPRTFARRVDFLVGNDGKIDMSSWAALATSSPHSFVAAAWAQVPEAYHKPTEPLEILNLFGDPSLPLFHGIFSQLIHELGLRLHKFLAGLAQSGKCIAGVSMQKVDMSDCLLDRCDMDAELVKYLLSVRSKLKGRRQYWTGCSDKSAVGGFSLQATMFAFGDNVAAVAPPAVCKGHTGALAQSVVAGGNRESVAAAKSDAAERMKGYLKRKRGICLAWKSVKRYRVASRHFVQNLDNQVRQVSDLKGLSHFKKDPEPTTSSQWSSWRRWPHMTLAMDMGPDNMSAFWWMVSEGVAITPIWDWSHGCSNDWKGMLRSNNLTAFWTLMIVTWNSATGPQQDRLRWKQYEEAWKVMFEQYSPSTCPLFAEYASKILHDRGGPTSLQGEGDTDTLLWETLKSEPPMKVVERVNMNRYFSSPRRAESELCRWHQNLMINEFVALEEGMINGPRIEKLVVRAEGGPGAAEERGTTNPAAVTLSDRALKANGDNSILVSIAMLSDDLNLAMVRIIVESGKATERWHSKQNKSLRSASAGQVWLSSQVGGEFFQHVCETFGKLADPAAIERCHIASPPASANIAEHNDSIFEVTRQDELSALFGKCTTSLASNRVVRSLWAIRGWPVAFAAALGGDGAQQRVLDTFRADLAAFRDLETNAERVAAVQRLLDRAIFRHVPVQQFVKALDDMDAGAAQLSDLQAVARGQMTGCLASQVAEDMFNHAKNSFLCKGKRQFRRPEKSFAAILARKVPERIHKYTAIEANQPVEKSAALAPEVFEASQQKCSLKVDTLSGTSASPAWYSTGPENVSRIHADLALFREMFSTKAYTAIAENAWLGQLLDHSHQIIIRRADSNDESAWLLCLHHWSDSSVLVWPCTRKPFEQNPSEYWFELHMGLQVPVLLAFYDLSLWQAATFEFRSPSWQRLHVGASLQRLPSAVRRVQRLPPQGVAAVGAKCGWWKLGKVFLSNLVKYLGGQVPAAASLFDTAVHLTEHVLECNRGDTLWHLRHRLAMDEASTSFCQELLEVEGVGSVLNREDEDSMKKTQKSAQVCLTEVRAFRCEFSAASLAQAKEQAKDQKKKRKKTSG